MTETVLEIFKLSGRLAIEGDHLTKELGLTSARWKVLGALQITDRALTVSQVAREMGLSRQAVQRLADAMVKDDLLVYRDNPHHKRAHHVVITKKGRQIYLKISGIQIPWANQKAEHINIADLNTTLSVLRQVTLLFD